jgi:hypothetical protein
MGGMHIILGFALPKRIYVLIVCEMLVGDVSRISCAVASFG